MKIARTPGRLSNEQLRALLEEGMELGRAFANKVSSMRVITPEDLKTRIK